MAGAPTYSMEELNYFRVCYVTTRIIPDGLRTVFKQEWDHRYKTTNGQWLDTALNGIEFINKESPRSQRKNSRAFMKIKNGNTLEWDCTDLFVGILYSDSIGASLIPGVKKSVDDLRQFRNDGFAHVSDGSLSEVDFQTSIQTVITAFTNLKLDTDVIEEIKNQKTFLTKELQEWMQLFEKEKKRNEEPKSFCVLPPKPSHEVIERPDEITGTLKEMERLRRVKTNEITIIYLSGNPGCGKSEMARQIGEKIFYDVFDKDTGVKFVFTLNASTLDTMVQSNIEFANRLKCDERSTTSIATSKDLSQEEKLIHLKSLIAPKLQQYSSWLLIIDNVTDIMSVSRYIPRTGDKTEGKGQLLVTTQDARSIANEPYIYHTSLKLGMKCDEAIRALCEISNIDADKQIISQIVKALDSQPLALACAATYMSAIRSTGLCISWEKYMEKLEEGKREATEKKYQTISSAYPKSMTVAVKMAVEKEMKERGIIMHALQFLSVMAPEPIPLEYVVQYVTRCMPDEDEHLVAESLSKSSLILSSEDEMEQIHVHQVVHSCLQTVIQHNNIIEFAFLANVCQTFSVLQSSYDIDKVKFLVASRSLVVHFTNLARSLSPYLSNIVLIPEEHLQKEHISINKSLLLIGRICHDHGKYEDSHTYHKISLLIAEKMFDQNHPTLAITLNNLGGALGHLGKHEEAKKFYERALAIEEMVYDQNHPTLATTLSNLGGALRHLGKHEEAKKFYERASGSGYYIERKMNEKLP